MDNLAIGKKIIQYRKLKGLSQEALAEEAGLNVRSIQRIEAGEVSPRLYTLRAIAGPLGVNVEDLLPESTQHELNQIAILHLMPVGFFLFPVIGNILLPFIFWMMKREEVNGIDRQGRILLNAQLTYSIIVGFIFGVMMAIIFMPMFFPQNNFPQQIMMRFPLFMVIGFQFAFIVFGVIPAINAYRVFNRKQPLKYPLSIHFFK